MMAGVLHETFSILILNRRRTLVMLCLSGLFLIVSLIRVGLLGLPDLLLVFFGIPEILLFHHEAGVDWSENLKESLLVLVLVAGLDAAFLWGGGRIAVGRDPVNLLRLLVPAAVVSLMLAYLALGCVLAFLDLTAMMVLPMAEEEQGNAEASDVYFYVFLAIFFVAILLYLLVTSKRHSQLQAVARMLLHVIGATLGSLGLCLPVYAGVNYPPQDPADLFSLGFSRIPLILSMFTLTWAVAPTAALLHVRSSDTGTAVPKDLLSRLLRRDAAPHRPRRADGPT